VRWLWTLLLSLSFIRPVHAQPRNVRIGVLGIFHPKQLTLAADEGGELFVSAADQNIFVQPRSACGFLRIRSSGTSLLLSCGEREIRAQEMHASGRNQQFVGLLLTIPGKIKRRYQGILEITVKNGELIPVVTMDLETAVASVVQAETVAGTPLEALKAQAIVSRSYFVAGAGRHADFDFCDTTHCQFLREPPPADSPARAAVSATRGLVLTYNDKPFGAMFTRSCGGRTRTPQEIGVPQNGYPYFSVICDFCYRNPIRWTRKLSSEDSAQLIRHGENGRLAICRRLGWEAIPSNNFSVEEQNGEITLRGVGEGHGLGLCERGGRDMAEHGSDFRAILDHYFPNTTLKELFSSLQ